jgi:AcrR family transcriptional regulator
MAASFEAVLARAVVPPEAEPDPTAERILDAALDQVAAFGVKGTTIDQVAERAAVGRVTVFRKFGTKDELMEILAVREARRFLFAIGAAAGPIDDPAERLVETAVAALGFAADHPLLARLTNLEPETVLAILRADRPPLMTFARQYVISQLEIDRGNLPGVNVELVAEAMVRVGLSFVLVPGGPVDMADAEQVRAFARASLVPLLTP